MAKCTVKLPDEFAEKLSKLGDKTDDICEKVLEAGGKVALTKVKSNLSSVLSGKSSGQLQSALGLSKVRINRKGNPDIKVGFAENRKDRKSNAMLANILEHGKHNQPPRPFLKPAKSAARNSCIDAMKSKLEEEIKKI